MERSRSRVEHAFQHGHLLTIKKREYREWVLAFLNLQFDVDRRSGDITSKLLFTDPRAPMEARIIANEEGVLAGSEELSAFCEFHKITWRSELEDGHRIKRGMEVGRLAGSVVKLLETERGSLDLLGRMSGIATLTRELAKRARPVPVAATRKTMWGPLDKKGVFVGGGFTHRLGLWQAPLIKDNHLSALRNFDVEDPFPEALELSEAGLSKKKVPFAEIEVQTFEEALEVIRLFPKRKFEPPFALLLDNFSPDAVHDVMRLLEKRKLRNKILVEVSGGITEKNLALFAKAKPDLISIGRLTHSPRTLSFSEEIIVETRAGVR